MKKYVSEGVEIHDRKYARRKIASVGESKRWSRFLGKQESSENSHVNR
jgi:hypothetical protein